MVYNGTEDDWIAVGCIDDGVEKVPRTSACIFVLDKPKWADLPAGVPCYTKFSDSEQVDPSKT